MSFAEVVMAVSACCFKFKAVMLLDSSKVFYLRARLEGRLGVI